MSLHSKLRGVGCLFLALFLAPQVKAQTPLPTLANVAYGTHERQKLDFYQSNSKGVSPLLFFIHGGGWMTGDKANPDFLAKCLENGISVVSINYRLIQDGGDGSAYPPVKVCLDDARRALQFVRSKASEWKVDKTRVAGCGGSAGGFSALWLAFHPEMADPKSVDLVARESTRLSCVMAFVPQTTLDPQQMQQWIPNNQYGNHAFALPSMQDFLQKRSILLPWIKEFSPYELVSPDDPPVLMFYDNAPNPGQPYRDPPHSSNFGAGLAEKLKAVGIEYEVNYNNDAGKMKYPDLFSFFIAKLKPITSK